MKNTYFFLLVFLLPLLGIGQSFRTITFTGAQSDYNPAEIAAAPNFPEVKYAIAYDADFLYVSVFRETNNFGNDDALTFFIDTDAAINSTQGTMNGNPFDNVTPSFTFNVDYAVRVRGNNISGYNELRTWNETNSTWDMTRQNIPENFYGNNVRSIRISKADLGNPDFIRLVAYMGFPGGGGGIFAVSSNDTTGGSTPNFSGYYGTAAISRAGSNVVASNNVSASVGSFATGATVPAGTYTSLEITGDAMLGGNITIAQGGSMVFRNAASTLNAGSNNVTFNNWAGIQSETTQPTTITGTGLISFANGGISLKNNLAPGAQVILDMNTTVTNSLFSYQLQANKILRVNAAGRSLGTTPFYGPSSTLHLATNELTPANLWSSNSVSANAGVPHNVVIDQNLSLDGNRFINGYLKVDSGNVLLNNHRITFNASATNTAVLGPVLGTLTGGEFSTSRFIPARADGNRAFRFLSSPVNAGTINSALQNSGNSMVGFDTQVTGGTVANGFDQSGSNNPSMFRYINNPLAGDPNQNARWEAVANTTTELFNAGMPYRVFIRGDRTVDLNMNGTALNTTLRATGAPVTGTVTYASNSTVNRLSDAPSAFNMIGNPYLAKVDMRKVLNASTGVNPNVVYVWDPTLNTRGGYATVSVAGSDPSADFTSPMNSAANRFLQPWQSVFLVNSSSATAAAVVFNEDAKELDTTNTAVFSTPGALTFLNINLLNAAGTTIDAARAMYSTTGNAGVDDADILKLTNLDENISFNLQNANFVILNHAMPVNGEQFPLALTSYRAQNYTLQLQLNASIPGMDAYLIDTFLQTQTLVNGPITYAFTVDPNNASSAAGRFLIQFNSTTLGASDIAFAKAVTLYPNPVTNGMVYVSNGTGKPFNATIYNMLGQELLQVKDFNNDTLNISTLHAGQYLVRIEQGDVSKVEKLIVN